MASNSRRLRFESLESRRVLSLNWVTSGEASIDEDTIHISSAAVEDGLQSIALHGAYAELPPAPEYKITFDYDLKTWDSYSPDIPDVDDGFWDSFSFSVTDVPYAQLSLSDPISFPFVWGGSLWGDEVLETNAGTVTITFPGDSNTPRYLNVILDTLTPPTQDENYPSWGTVTVKLPDLEASDFEYVVPSDVTRERNGPLPVNVPFNLAFKITNNGDEQSEPTSASLYISLDGTIDPATDLLVTDIPIPALSIGQEMSFAPTGILLPILPATYIGEVYLGLFLNKDNVVLESEVDNNANLGEEVDMREVQLYDPVAQRGLWQVGGVTLTFPTRPDADAFLTANGFTLTFAILDAGWSRPLTTATVSRYNGRTMPADAFRIQAIPVRVGSAWGIGVQGAEAGFNPANLTTVFGEPSPRARWGWGLALLNYVRPYHTRF
jgi:hypothetical protein